MDLSKSPERLEIFIDNKNIDIWCLYLSRNLESVYASTLKRPKKTRSMYGPAALRESLWLALRQKHMNRIFKQIPFNRRLVVDWDKFVQHPVDSLQLITEWLDLAPYNDDNCDVRKIDHTKQHIYVGNRWLFKNNLKSTEISVKDLKGNLTPFQSFFFKIFNQPKK